MCIHVQIPPPSPLWVPTERERERESRVCMCVCDEYVLSSLGLEVPEVDRRPHRGEERPLDQVPHYRQPAGPNPLYHRDDLVDRPRAIYLPS